MDTSRALQHVPQMDLSPSPSAAITPSPSKTLPPIPGSWTTREIAVGGSTFRITLPADPDSFLDRDAQLPVVDDLDYMPYWGCLWPGAMDLAAELLAHPWPANARALEIGSGIGLAGVAALAAGLDVTLSDYDEIALDLALHNARQNGFTRAKSLLLDWRRPGATLPFDFVFGSDVIYARREHEQIVRLLEQAVTPHGQAWIADPFRPFANLFVELAESRGWSCRQKKHAESNILVLQRN